MNNNIILMADSYKASHWKQYPPKTNGYFGYIESRGGAKNAVFFGLQILLRKVLSKPITQEMIDEADEFYAAHGVPFNKEGWEYILRKYNGYIPVVIRAVPEGTVVPTKNLLASVECTDPVCFWVGSYIETIMLRAVWYGTTVASLSRKCKKIIYKYLKETSDDPDGQIKFKLHDFGARGVSSAESAGIGGAAHLVNFLGSDTVEGILYAKRYYDEPMAGFSIPAAEHSTITSWGRENEVEAYRNMLKQYGNPGAAFAVVSDSYNIFNACEKLWGEELKDEVIKSGAMVIIRPDSGDPITTVLKVIRILDEKFGSAPNGKGYKVLNNVRVIQGDGVTPAAIQEICATLAFHNYSIDNIAFGMGGALLQRLDRDTLMFAMKCSAIRVGDEWVDVYKQPVDSEWKASKKGRLDLYQKGHGVPNLVTLSEKEIEAIPEEARAHLASATKIVYDCGTLYNTSLFSEVRERAAI